MTIFKINCPNKLYATSGCTSCWTCLNSDVVSCDNTHWMKPEDTIEYYDCKCIRTKKCSGDKCMSVEPPNMNQVFRNL